MKSAAASAMRMWVRRPAVPEAFPRSHPMIAPSPDAMTKADEDDVERGMRVFEADDGEEIHGGVLC